MAKTSRGYLEIALHAWRSGDAIRFLPHLIVTPIAIASVPLVETRDTDIEFLIWLGASAVGQLAPALVLFLSWYLFYRAGSRPWWLIFVVGIITGVTKGISTFFLGQLFGADMAIAPDLLNRIVVSGLAWSISVPSLAIIGFLSQRANKKLSGLRDEISGISDEAKDLESQLDWLISKRMEGVGAELSQMLQSVAEKLRTRSGEQAVYAEVAAELRKAASQQVRLASHSYWQQTNSKQNPIVASAITTLLRNPMPLTLTTALFGYGYLLNELRIYGISSGLVNVAVITSVAFVTLWFLKKLESSSKLLVLLKPIIFTIFVTGFSAFWFYLEIPNRPEGYSLAATITMLIWSSLVIFLSGWAEATRKSYQDEIDRLEGKKQVSEADLQWLSLRLDTFNRELAKYLHGFVQTRLMAHAMHLENISETASGEELDAAINSLADTLSAPMAEFMSGREKLITEIEKLAQNWLGIVEFEVAIESSVDQLRDVLPTMQFIREAVSNSSKHGRANKVSISIKDFETKRHLKISDNGISTNWGETGLGSEIFNSISKGNYRLEIGRSGALIEADIDFS